MKKMTKIEQFRYVCLVCWLYNLWMNSSRRSALNLWASVSRARRERDNNKKKSEEEEEEEEHTKGRKKML